MISLQKMVSAVDAEFLARSEAPILHFGNELTDFAATAGLIELIDLVVTVDTAVAHLAGAMGKEVWILLPKRADWRWLVDRTDSPWYPRARLFRQTVEGDWRGPLEAVNAALIDRFGLKARV
jgi:ADP-heptose:LPS heptosyltransferase